MTLDRAYVDDLRELATEQCKETVTHVVDMLVPQGVAYSDKEITDDGDFLRWYLDLRDRGVIDYLPLLAPRFTQRLQQRFQSVVRTVLLRSERLIGSS